LVPGCFPDPVRDDSVAGVGQVDVALEAHQRQGADDSRLGVGISLRIEHSKEIGEPDRVSTVACFIALSSWRYNGSVIGNVPMAEFHGPVTMISACGAVARSLVRVVSRFVA
jgi:hypothetical protein